MKPHGNVFQLTWMCILHCLCLGAKPKVAAVSATLLRFLTPCLTAYIIIISH